MAAGPSGGAQGGRRRHDVGPTARNPGGPSMLAPSMSVPTSAARYGSTPPPSAASLPSWNWSTTTATCASTVCHRRYQASDTRIHDAEHLFGRAAPGSPDNSDLDGRASSLRGDLAGGVWHPLHRAGRCAAVAAESAHCLALPGWLPPRRLLPGRLRQPAPCSTGYSHSLLDSRRRRLSVADCAGAGQHRHGAAALVLAHGWDAGRRWPWRSSSPSTRG